jgi:hypothetical protein
MPSSLDAVLTAMAKNGGSLPADWAAQALAESGADPRLAALFQVAGTTSAEPEEPASADEVDGMDAEEFLALEDRCARLERLAHLLYRRLARLAGAIGACPRCAGADHRGCDACDGTGAGPFDAALFSRLIVPSVTRAAPHWPPPPPPDSAVPRTTSNTQGVPS